VFYRQSVTETPTDRRSRAIGRPGRLIGWFCAAGIALVIIEMVSILPWLPDCWWISPGERVLRPGEIDLRYGVMHPGLMGWLGAWGYLASWIWFPVSLWRALRAQRRGIPLQSEERVLLALVPSLFCVAEAILRLTPLRYAYPLV
jgi:hypothetical protein